MQALTQCLFADVTHWFRVFESLVFIFISTKVGYKKDNIKKKKLNHTFYIKVMASDHDFLLKTIGKTSNFLSSCIRMQCTVVISSSVMYNIKFKAVNFVW